MLNANITVSYPISSSDVILSDRVVSVSASMAEIRHVQPLHAIRDVTLLSILPVSARTLPRSFPERERNLESVVLCFLKYITLVCI